MFTPSVAGQREEGFDLSVASGGAKAVRSLVCVPPSRRGCPCKTAGDALRRVVRDMQKADVMAGETENGRSVNTLIKKGNIEMNMKAQMAAAAVMAMGMMSAGAMADAGAGSVTFTGTVSDAPCNIAAESVDQTVPFGLISKSYLNSNKEVMKNFDIKLEQCDTTTLKTTAITFYGPNSATGAELSATGGAKNVAVRLASAGGNDITLGTAVDTPVQGDAQVLKFVAYAKKAAGAAADVTEGEFSSVADFRMSYK